MPGDTWAADVTVSKPEPLGDLPAIADFDGGFVFTTGGMAHGLTETEVEEVFTPTYAPSQGGG